MFEELYRLPGIVRIDTGTYADSLPIWENYPVIYFAQEKVSRDEQGVMQSDTIFFIKGSDELEITTGDKFVDVTGREWDIAGSARIFNHFDNAFECHKLTVTR